VKLCQRHMADAVAELKRRNLWRLVAQDPQVLRARTAAWLAGRSHIGELDPLVIVVLEILNKARALGVNGDFCPICETERVRKHPDLGPLWIQEFTDRVEELLRHNEVIA